MIAALGEDADVPALHGWRWQVFGEDALKLRRGRSALVLRSRTLIHLVDFKAKCNAWYP
jgi:ribonuclease D